MIASPTPFPLHLRSLGGVITWTEELYAKDVVLVFFSEKIYLASSLPNLHRIMENSFWGPTWVLEVPLSHVSSQLHLPSLVEAQALLLPLCRSKLLSLKPLSESPKLLLPKPLSRRSSSQQLIIVPSSPRDKISLQWNSLPLIVLLSILAPPISLCTSRSTVEEPCLHLDPQQCRGCFTAKPLFTLIFIHWIFGLWQWL